MEHFPSIFGETNGLVIASTVAWISTCPLGEIVHRPIETLFNSVCGGLLSSWILYQVLPENTTVYASAALLGMAAFSVAARSLYVVPIPERRPFININMKTHSY